MTDKVTLMARNVSVSGSASKLIADLYMSEADRVQAIHDLLLTLRLPVRLRVFDEVAEHAKAFQFARTGEQS